ncbi:HK97 family phage prohead protease [Leifsonia aquatica]|uniref:HK97 family phage prohead protease n=1 Tax=Leifsonia aquatica TaxID=144185 RepID=UPI0037F8C70D
MTTRITASAVAAPSITAIAYGITASVENRTITGTITAFERVSNDNRLYFHAGCITARQPLRRVKLLRDHDTRQPVGFMTALSADALTATFKVPEGPDGDRALAEAANGLRDGLSVGLLPSPEPGSYEFDDNGVLHVYKAEMHEVSLVAIPAFADGQVIDVAAAMTPPRKDITTMTLEQLQAALAAGQITQADFDRQVAALNASAGPAATATPPAPAAAPAVAAEVAAGPVAQVVATGAPAIQVQERGMSLRQAAAHVAAAFNSGGSLAQITAALEDIIPADDEGTAWLGRDDWMGELFTASDETRRWIDAWGGTQPLLTLSAGGWRWKVRPKGGKYAGNKQGVPTNKPKTEKARFVAERWAGGWDVDRAFIDFADAEFLSAFWQAAMAEYKLDSDADIATKTLAAANVGAQATDALGVVLGIASDMRKVRGASLSQVFLSDDLYDEWAEYKLADLPAWLANAVGGVEVVDGTARVTPKLTIEADPLVPAATGVGFDRRAATVREKTPLQLNQLNIAQAGVDLGFYSYGRLDIHDPRLIVARSTAPAGAAALKALADAETTRIEGTDEDDE